MCIPRGSHECFLADRQTQQGSDQGRSQGQQLRDPELDPNTQLVGQTWSSVWPHRSPPSTVRHGGRMRHDIGQYLEITHFYCERKPSVQVASSQQCLIAAFMPRCRKSYRFCEVTMITSQSWADSGMAVLSVSPLHSGKARRGARERAALKTQLEFCDCIKSLFGAGDQTQGLGYARQVTSGLLYL